MIGNKDSAITIATMMCERYGHEKVDILANGLARDFSGRSIDLAKAYNMTIHDAAILEVLGDPKGEGLQGYRLADGTHVESNCSIVSLGTIVYNELLTALGGKVDPAGKVVVTDKFETTVPGFYAVGDLVTGKKMQIYTAWDEAVDAADDINRRLRKTRREKKLKN